jgi:hypothetical protein
MVCGRSAYDINGNLISGNISPRSASDICLSEYPTFDTNATYGTPTCRYPRYEMSAGCYNKDILIGLDLGSYNANLELTGISNCIPTNATPTITVPQGYRSQAQSISVCLSKFQPEISIAETKEAASVTVPLGYYPQAVSKNFKISLYEQEFTYVVDSSEALARWIRNDDGYDYSKVLIKKGTWSITLSSTNAIDLTATKTVIVVGEPGSLLSFSYSGNIKALRYTTSPADSDIEHYMYNVHVKLSTSSGECYGFSRCVNLIDCSCEFTCTSNAGTCYGFFNCNRLTNCTVNCTGKPTNAGGGSGYGFYSCHGLVNCSTNANDFMGTAGFIECFDLINCQATCSGNQWIMGFSECHRLFNCISLTSSTGPQSNSRAYNGCKYLRHCNGVSESPTSTTTSGQGSGIAYLSCIRVKDCQGRGYGGKAGYGFSSCKGVQYCKRSILAGPTTTSSDTTGETSWFYSCWVDPSGTVSLVSNTSDGGWNIT